MVLGNNLVVKLYFIRVYYYGSTIERGVIEHNSKVVFSTKQIKTM